MTAAELRVVNDTEMERVEHWRAEELIRAGYSPTDAVALAARHDIDLHRAIGLISQGCPYELAIEILIYDGVGRPHRQSRHGLYASQATPSDAGVSGRGQNVRP